MDNAHRQGLFFLYLAVFLLTLNGLFAKVIPLDAVSITGLRSILAAIAIFLFIQIRRSQLMPESWQILFGIWGLGIVMGGHWITFFHSMQISSIAIGMLSLYSYPVITVLIEAFFQRQVPKISDLLAGIIVLIGLAIMLTEHWDNLQGNVSMGVFWGVLSAFLFSLRNTTQKYYFSKVPSDQLMLHQVIIIAVVLFLFIDQPELAKFEHKDWLNLVILGVVTTAGAHTLLTLSLKRLKAKTVAMIGCVQPVFAAFVGWLILGEQVDKYVLIGGSLILSVAVYESVNKK